MEKGYSNLPSRNLRIKLRTNPALREIVVKCLVLLITHSLSGGKDGITLRYRSRVALRFASWQSRNPFERRKLNKWFKKSNMRKKLSIKSDLKLRRFHLRFYSRGMTHYSKQLLSGVWRISRIRLSVLSHRCLNRLTSLQESLRIKSLFIKKDLQSHSKQSTNP